jgi:ribulose-phosphate 3-epimerase
MAIEILPTNTCPPDYPELVRRSKAFAQFSPRIHLDLSDGKFTPVTSWPYGEGQWTELEKMEERKEVLPLAKISAYEVHLMVQDALRVGTYMARVGCRRVLAHLEAFHNAGAVKEAFSAWRAGGAEEVGLALLIDTPLSALDEHVSQCDEVLLMSIPTLGKQGAPFDERIYERVRELHTKHPDLAIGIDGGVGQTNIAKLAEAGATRFGVGSAITKTENPAAAYEALLASIKSGSSQE